jgi:hypothetical protein
MSEVRDAERGQGAFDFADTVSQPAGARANRTPVARFVLAVQLPTTVIR